MNNVLNAQTEHELFGKLIDQYRYDFCKLVYVIFPFGQKGHALEHKRPRAWQMEEWAKMSVHLQNPLTRFKTYRLVISTGNGSGKTAFGAMTEIMMMYSQKLRGRVTSNTKPQLTQIVWPEYDKWFNHARYSNIWFEKLGESIKSRDEEFKEQWRFDMFTWDEANPAAVSGLHNEGHAILYTFEEAPGIPANIFDYARGAFSDANTIKFWLVFGNSDDPDSKFEQLMNDPDWNSRRIDTRTLEDVDKDFVAMVLKDCGGDEDHDEDRHVHRLRSDLEGPRHCLDPVQSARTAQRHEHRHQAQSDRDPDPGADGPSRTRRRVHGYGPGILRGRRPERLPRRHWRRTQPGASDPRRTRLRHRHLRRASCRVAEAEHHGA